MASFCQEELDMAWFDGQGVRTDHESNGSQGWGSKPPLEWRVAGLGHLVT